MELQNSPCFDNAKSISLSMETSNSISKPNFIRRRGFRWLFCTSFMRRNRRTKNLSKSDKILESSVIKDIKCEFEKNEKNLHANLFQEMNCPLNTKDSIEFQYIECPLCLDYFPQQSFPKLINCKHLTCEDCFKHYFYVEISECRINITCPQCSEFIHPNDLYSILKDNIILLQKYEEFMLRHVLVIEPDARWCPAPDCKYVVIANGCAPCPKLQCHRPGCGTFFCYHCKETWHHNQTCDTARAQRSRQLESICKLSLETLIRDQIKICPGCNAFITKMNDGSCNHMTCIICGMEFCWLCMEHITDLHYLSPSGCTFWGKKRWSKKKKLLWQLGTLMGAPVGIILVAGLAIPAMIIGIPIWVGRKLHVRFQNENRSRQITATTAAVSVAALLSPMIAGLTVAIGIPVLLFYVYGIIPMYLCKNMYLCILSGVRSEAPQNNSGNNTREYKVLNPSVGELSLLSGMSISTESESNVEHKYSDPVGTLKHLFSQHSLQDGHQSYQNESHQTSLLALAGSLLSYKQDEPASAVVISSDEANSDAQNYNHKRMTKLKCSYSCIHLNNVQKCDFSMRSSHSCTFICNSLITHT